MQVLEGDVEGLDRVKLVEQVLGWVEWGDTKGFCSLVSACHLGQYTTVDRGLICNGLLVSCQKTVLLKRPC